MGKFFKAHQENNQNLIDQRVDVFYENLFDLKKKQHVQFFSTFNRCQIKKVVRRHFIRTYMRIFVNLVK